MTGEAARSSTASARFFAGYRLLKLLGRGGMAEVFLAEKLGPKGTRARKLYALKRILPQYADSPDRVERFVEEMNLAVTLEHPNIVEVKDFGEEGGTYWLSLELIHGMDLRRLCEELAAHARQHGERYPGQKDGILPPVIVAWIALQGARGLDYLHRQKRLEGSGSIAVIHRDISPDNLMMDLHGRVKISDFGISKSLAGEVNVASATAHAYGKLLYAPPEQLSGKPIDARADLYAFGVTLYVLLTGANPYDDPSRPDEDPWGKVARAAKQEREPIAALAPIAALPTPVPQPMLDVLERLIRSDASERPATAEELIAPFHESITALGENLLTVQRLAGELVGLVYKRPDTIAEMAAAPDPTHEPPQADDQASPSRSTTRSARRPTPPDRVAAPAGRAAGSTTPLPTIPLAPPSALVDAANGPTPPSPEASARTKKLRLAIGALSVVVAGLAAFAAAFFVGLGPRHDARAHRDEAARADVPGGPVAPETATEPAHAVRDELATATAGEAPAVGASVRTTEPAPPRSPTEPRAPSEAAAAERDAPEEPPPTARLRIYVLPFGELRVDGRRVAPGEWHELPAGTHRVVATSAGRRQVRQIDLRAGQREQIVFRF